MLIRNFQTPIFYNTFANNNNCDYKSDLKTRYCSDCVSFKKNENRDIVEYAKYKKAMAYAKKLSTNDVLNLNKKDIQNLEGIQYNLKSFQGLTFQEIYFLLTKINDFTIPLYRDCAGMCLACYANGRPAEHQKKDQIRRIDFEDFKNFTNDLKTISQRLHYNFVDNATKCNKARGLLYSHPNSSLFYDSDCKDIWLEDKNKKVYEFPELNKMLYDATGIAGLFDTAGWAKSNSKVQKRMEALAQYYSKPCNQKELNQINISINTYNGVVEKANEYKRKGDTQNYEKLLNIYASNIANAMYTFTPLLGTKIYGTITRAVNNREDSKFNDYKNTTLNKIIQKILNILEERYKEDLKKENYKFVKNKNDIITIMEQQKALFGPTDDLLSPSARKNIFSDLGKNNVEYIDTNILKTVEHVLLGLNGNLLIDVNGKTYMGNDTELFKTDIQLNFMNKHKNSKTLYPIANEKILRIKENKVY